MEAGRQIPGEGASFYLPRQEGRIAFEHHSNNIQKRFENESRKAESGSIKVNSKELINKKPKEIFDNGIKNIPEDRHKRGLILDFTVAENTVLQNYKDPRFSKNGILNKDAIEKYADEIIERFDVRPTDHTVKSRALSGGNQQKIIIGREVDNIDTARKVTG